MNGQWYLFTSISGRVNIQYQHLETEILSVCNKMITCVNMQRVITGVSVHKGFREHMNGLNFSLGEKEHSIHRWPLKNVLIRSDLFKVLLFKNLHHLLCLGVKIRYSQLALI